MRHGIGLASVDHQVRSTVFPREREASAALDFERNVSAVEKVERDLYVCILAASESDPSPGWPSLYPKVNCAFPSL